MEYRTYAPSPDLSQHVRFYWTLESDVAGEAPHRLTAEACPGLVFICAGRFHEADGSPTPPALLAGPSDTFMNNTAFGPFSLFGVYLWPWATQALFGGDARTHVCGIIALHTLWGPQGHHLEARVMACRTRDERMALLTDVLRQRLAAADHPDPLMEAIVRRILTEHGATPIEELIAESGLARRQFERRFKPCAGFSPALFLRIVRFQRSFRMLENGGATSLTGMAHACGYFDQSHFIRDFKRFSGLNPRDYFIKAPEKVDNFVRLPQ